MLLCLTANHRNASFDFLEKLSFGAETAATALVHENLLVGGAVVLATCNRFEAYLEVDAEVTADAVTATVQALGGATGVEPVVLRETISVLTGDDVVEHLFAVSSGLESVVMGEDEISGQVRRALERARGAGTTTAGLEHLFQRASSASRAVKSTTSVASAGRSIVRLALELASSRIADWSTTRVLMVGTGSYARATLAALADRGAYEIVVFSPSGRAEGFAGARGIAWTTDLSRSIAETDVVITCTTVEQHVVTAESVTPGRQRLIIDLGLPRNVEPVVGAVDGVTLLDLETISLHAPLDELNAATDARAAVGRAAAAFTAAEAEQSLTPAVVALRTHVFDVLDAEIARARRRSDSTPETEAALRHLAGVLLHTPSVRARELARTGQAQSFTEGIAALFGIRLPDIADTATERGEHPATA